MVNKIVVVGPDMNSRGGISSMTKILFEGIQNDDFSLYPFSTSNSLFSFFKEIRRFRKLVKSEEVKLIHFNVSTGGSFLRKYILSKQLNAETPYIIHLHGGRFREYYDKGNAFLKKRIISFFDKSKSVVPVSNNLKEFVEEILPPTSKIQTIYNGVETLERLRSERSSIVFMASFGEHKGINDFFKIAYDLQDINVTFDIYGYGSDEQIEKVKKASDMQKNVFFHGWADYSMKVKAMNKALLLINPTDFESFGITTVEALSAGTPVIAYSNGALPEVIGEGGILIPPKNIDQMKEKTRTLIEDQKKWEQLSIKAFKQSEKFSIENFISSFIDFYSKEIRKQ